MVQGLEWQIEEFKMNSVEQKGLEAGVQYNLRNILHKFKSYNQTRSNYQNCDNKAKNKNILSTHL